MEAVLRDFADVVRGRGCREIERNFVMQFSWQEMLVKDRAAGTFHNESAIPAKALANMRALQPVLNEFLADYGAPGFLNCVWRDPAGVQPQGGAARSPHHIGAAADIQDTDGSLARYVMNRYQKLADCGLYCEDFLYTHACAPNKAPSSGWCHFDLGAWSTDFTPRVRTTRIFKPF
jgi:hypothetical protein